MNPLPIIKPVNMTLDKISSYWHTWLICKENMDDHFSKLIVLTIKADALKTSIWSIITVTSLLKYFILSLTYNYYYYKFFFCLCVCVFTCSQTFLLFNTPKKKIPQLSSPSLVFSDIYNKFPCGEFHTFL